jgi:hypothetical protein
MTKRIIETEDVTHQTKNALGLAARREGVPVEQLLGHVAPKAPVRYWGAALTLIICMTASFTTAWFWQAERLADDGDVALTSRERPSLEEAEMRKEILRITGGDFNKPLGEAGGNSVHLAMRSGENYQLIDYLATTDADFNFRRKYGVTPLMAAAHKGNYGNIIYVLTHYRHKVDLTIKNDHGKTLADVCMLKLNSTGQRDPMLAQVISLINGT